MTKKELYQIQKFLQGDRAAFSFLYRRHEAYFLRTAEFFKGVTASAEDLVQMAAEQILNKDLKTKDAEKFNFKDYFTRTIHNVFIDETRRHKRHLDIGAAYRVPMDDPYIEPNYDPLYRHMRQLSRGQQKVLKLRLRGFKYKEIGKKMHLSHNTAIGMFRYAAAYLRNTAGPTLMALKQNIYVNQQGSTNSDRTKSDN